MEAILVGEVFKDCDTTGVGGNDDVVYRALADSCSQLR